MLLVNKKYITSSKHLCFAWIESAPTISTAFFLFLPLTINMFSSFIASPPCPYRCLRASIMSIPKSTFFGLTKEPLFGCLQQYKFQCNFNQLYYINQKSLKIKYLHSKYLTPSCIPLCFPLSGSSHSMPYHSPKSYQNHCFFICVWSNNSMVILGLPCLYSSVFLQFHISLQIMEDQPTLLAVTQEKHRPGLNLSQPL